MAWRNTYRPHLIVEEPRLEPRSWVSSGEIYLAEDAHQVVCLTVMHSSNPSYPTQAIGYPGGVVWPENTPIHLRYGWWEDDSGEFYGYVASSKLMSSEVDPRYGYAVQQSVQYTLVGASMPMQTRKNRVWRDTSPSAIARQIATEHGLRSVIDLSSVHFEQRMQASSDWVFLVDVSDQIGYRVFCDNTTLWFVDRETVLAARDQSVPEFTSSKKPGFIDTIREFEASVGDTDPAGGIRPKYETVAMNRTSNVLMPAVFAQNRTALSGAQVTPILDRQYEDRPAGSYSAAKRLLEADTEWLWVASRTVTNGDPRLKPGSVVDLRGAALGPTHLGRWMVRSATHRIDVNLLYPQKGNYTTECVLGRNDARQIKLRVQTKQPQEPPSILVNGRWRAQYAGAAR